MANLGGFIKMKYTVKYEDGDGVIHESLHTNDLGLALKTEHKLKLKYNNKAWMSEISKQMKDGK